jgi:hypothetical protein
VLVIADREAWIENRLVRQVLVVAVDGCQLLDVAGPMDVFDAAGKLGGDYRVRVATPGGCDIRSESGLRLGADVAVERSWVCGPRCCPRTPSVRLLARHPRDGFAVEIEELSARQAAARPRSRVALLREPGLADLIRRGEHTFIQLAQPST